MLPLLMQGQYGVFALVLFALVLSLTFHEYSHAATAYAFGDDTAQKAGRLTLNPLSHIDPQGLLLVVLIGFGYARPVPFNPFRLSSPWGRFFIAAAGPAMNALIALVAVNLFLFAVSHHIGVLASPAGQFFFSYLAHINILLALFNLLPIGALDGHHILPYLLPANLARRYALLNQQYGNRLLFLLVIVNMLGVPVFQSLWKLGDVILHYMRFV